MSRFNTAAALAAQLVRDASKCPTCGKPRFVMNTDLRHRAPYAPESVSPATHCACVGGPAHAATQIQ